MPNIALFSISNVFIFFKRGPAFQDTGVVFIVAGEHHRFINDMFVRNDIAVKIL